MAGYSWENGMSNNAVAAYENGLAPAGVWAKRLGLTVREITEHVQPTEWHHASKFFRKVNFYSLADVLEAVSENGDFQCTSPRRRLLWLRARNYFAAHLCWEGARDESEAFVQSPS